MLSEAIEAAGRLLAQFPSNRGGDGFIGALADVLASYPRSVVSNCCNVKTGVARSVEFLSIAALVTWCERETEQLLRQPIHRLDRDEALAAERRRDADEDRVLAEARKTRPTYDELKAKYGPNWGIANPPRKRPSPFRTLDQLRAEFGDMVDAVPHAPRSAADREAGQSQHAR